MSLSTEPFTTTTTSPENTTFPVIIDPRCSSYYSNSSGIIIKEYEGIPENLIVNLAAWVGLLILFTFLRRIGDYGRFGLIKNDEERFENNQILLILGPFGNIYDIFLKRSSFILTMSY